MNSKAQTEVLILIGVFIVIIGYGIYSVVQINDYQGVDVNQPDENQNNNILNKMISPNNTLLNQNNNSNNQAPTPTGQSGSNSSPPAVNQDPEEDNSPENHSSQADADEEANTDAEDDSVDLNDGDSEAVDEPLSDYEEENENADSNYTAPVPPTPPVPPATTFTTISISAPNTSYNTYDPFTLILSTNIPGVNISQISIYKNENYTTNCQPNLSGSTSSIGGQYYSFGGQTNSSNQFVVSFNNGCTEIGQYNFLAYANYGGVSRNATLTLNISTFAPTNGEIRYLEHLAYIDTNSETRAGNYTLMNDLDFQNTNNYLDSRNKTLWTTGNGWSAIGYKYNNSITGFTGNFNGNNKKIENLYINKPLISNQSLFGFIESGATISNLSLEDVNVTGQNYVSGLVSDNGGNISNCQVSGLIYSPYTNTAYYVHGGLVGLNYGTITNCSFNGKVEGIEDVGGLVGKNFMGNYQYIGGKIYNSSSSGTVIGRSSGIGGLVGDNSYGLIQGSNSTSTVTGVNSVGGLAGFMGNFYAAAGKIINSHFVGDVTGSESVGGIVGFIERGDVNNSYSIANVEGNKNIGGSIGNLASGTIETCFSKGEVRGNENVGGFIGLISGNNLTKVSNSYSLANVSRKTGTNTYLGGFVGYKNYTNSNTSEVFKNNYSIGRVSYTDSENPIENGFSGFSSELNAQYDIGNFWDTETSFQLTSPSGAIGKTTTEMKTQSTFTGWDFSTIWSINPSTNSGYPYLRNNPPQ